MFVIANQSNNLMNINTKLLLHSANENLYGIVSELLVNIKELKIFA